MRKQTDLDEVKRTAITLLHTDIYETPYSPMIVKHPFSIKKTPWWWSFREPTPTCKSSCSPLE